MSCAGIIASFIKVENLNDHLIRNLFVLEAEKFKSSYFYKDSNGNTYVNGLLHSVKLKPAVIESDGTRKWYKRGLLHRDDDFPSVIRENGTREWYKNGKRHRIGGAAVITLAGSREWFENGKRHRKNGPAIDVVQGDVSYYYYGVTTILPNRSVKSMILDWNVQSWFIDGKLQYIKYPAKNLT